MEIIPIFSPEYQTFNFCIFLGLNKTMAASLGYLLDETDPSLTQGVLFEVRLELSEPDVIFVPPLDKNLVDHRSYQQDFCPNVVQKSHQVQTVQV